MDFSGVTDIVINSGACVVDASCGTDNVCRVITAKEKYFDCKLDDGLLTITQKSRNILYRIIMHRIELKIVLPKVFRGKLKLRNKNGGLYAKGGCFTDFDVSTKNGKFDVSDIHCEQFILKQKNGSTSIKNLRSDGNATVKCKNGPVRVETATANVFSISSANAALTAIDVVSKTFACSTKNGTIDASAIAADELQLKTSNGKINAAPLGKRDDYRLTADTAHGAISVDGVAQKRMSDVNQTPKRMSVKTVNGDIDIRFV